VLLRRVLLRMRGGPPTRVPAHDPDPCAAWSPKVWQAVAIFPACLGRNSRRYSRRYSGGAKATEVEPVRAPLAQAVVARQPARQFSLFATCPTHPGWLRHLAMPMALRSSDPLPHCRNPAVLALPFWVVVARAVAHPSA